ncbi:unnamed protein product, partial [Mesorhabditis spiculigera]
MIANQTGHLKVSTRVIVRSYIGMFVFCSMLSANWAIIIYCGWALNKALKSKGISNRTKTMQKELFRALIFQLIVPICCVFGPLGKSFWQNGPSRGHHQVEHPT